MECGITKSLSRKRKHSSLKSGDSPSCPGEPQVSQIQSATLPLTYPSVWQGFSGFSSMGNSNRGTAGVHCAIIGTRIDGLAVLDGRPPGGSVATADSGFVGTAGAASGSFFHAPESVQKNSIACSSSGFDGGANASNTAKNGGVGVFFFPGSGLLQATRTTATPHEGGVPCSHCERPTIELQQCTNCALFYCSVCSIINYQRREDRVFCLTCNEDLKKEEKLGWGSNHNRM